MTHSHLVTGEMSAIAESGDGLNMSIGMAGDPVNDVDPSGLTRDIIKPPI